MAEWKQVLTKDDVCANGPRVWTHNFGGYKTSNSSTSYYYFQYYPNNNSWANSSNAIPVLSAEQDIYSAEWIAPYDGKLTKLDVFVKGNDDCQFHIYKGTVSEDGDTGITLVSLGSSGACGIDSSLKTFYKTTDFSSFNTFSAGDGIWIMLKKDTHAVSTSFYFTGVISGEFT